MIQVQTATIKYQWQTKATSVFKNPEAAENMSTIHNILLTPKMSAHSLDLHFDVEIDNGGRLKTELHDKLDNFTFTISHFLFISNIPSAPVYGVYI